ncbi:hypothetical protein [Sporosarcina luteola]|uniref:hypothetical protein n=1 Tax=Sporosarcina luteola TaxID=582850 RepID=UPI00203B9FB0|nr:hypothetical protein [Sporosarcina luteola]MCM3710721.1 hypothetical protein [Sporosarcina luteola]
MSGWVTVLVGTFAPTIALVGYLMTVSTNKKQRIMASISAQRTDWLNELRHAFVKYNAACLSYDLIRFTTSLGQNEGVSVWDEYQAVLSSQNHITLLLNPKEQFVKELIFEINKQTDLLLGRKKYDKSQIDLTKKRINDLQQIILKAEWERIRTETKKGRQVKTSEMDLILKNTSLRINNEIYKEVILNVEQ